MHQQIKNGSEDAEDADEDEGRIDPESVREKASYENDDGSGQHLNIGDESECLCLILGRNCVTHESLESRVNKKQEHSEQEKA